MQSKKYTLLFFIIYPTLIFSQDWTLFNDTLVYYYQSELDGNTYTLRTDSIEVIEFDSTIFFTNNYIHFENPEFDPAYEYHRYNGSVLGNNLHYFSDTILIYDDYYFYSDFILGETKMFSESKEITYSIISDTILFGLEDSVKYFQISDGNKLILSKEFGLIALPDLYQDSENTFQLIGIEGYVGTSFDHHNDIFDFEIGDLFVYKEFYRYYIGDSEFETYSQRVYMEVLDKFMIDGHFYYQVVSDGGDEYYPVYPLIYEGNPTFDYPGEKVVYCRANDVYSGTGGYGDEFLIDNEKFVTPNLGHRYSTNPDDKLVHTIGFGELGEDYESFGAYYDLYEFPWSNPLHYAGSEFEDIVVTWFDPHKTICVYEEELGLSYFYWEGGFANIFNKSLIGVIRDGDTLGNFDLSLYENQYKSFHFYPNPVSNSIFMETELSNIEVIDMTGGVLLHESNSTEINVSDLPRGVYMIIGTDVNGALRYGKFVKE